MITQVNGIGSSAALSKKAKPAAMDLDRVRIPRDVAFTGAEKLADEVKEKAPGLLKGLLKSKFFTGIKDFVAKIPGFFGETVPKYAKKAWGFLSELPGKISKIFKGAEKVAGDAAEKV